MRRPSETTCRAPPRGHRSPPWHDGGYDDASRSAQREDLRRRAWRVDVRPPARESPPAPARPLGPLADPAPRRPPALLAGSLLVIVCASAAERDRFAQR